MKKSLIFVLILLILFSINIFSKNAWTVMVYMAADNDMEYFSWEAFNQLEQYGGQTGWDTVEVVVLWDRAEGYLVTEPDWDNTRIYNIEQNSDTSSIASNYMDWIPFEANMADPQTLVDFVKYCNHNNPANNYMLLFWGPGEGFMGEVLRENNNRFAGLDYTNQDFMTINELEQAFRQIRVALGQKVDIVGFDSSLTQMVEIMWPLRNYANYIIGSQQNQPSSGWPYNIMFPEINANLYSAEKILENMVDNYIDYYEGNAGWNVTMSYVNLNNLDDLNRYIRRFSTRMQQNFHKNFEVFREALHKATYFDRGQNVDLFSFFS
ncbi:MAG: clostripain-related cysteine peptidase, partial [Candidatus Muiribacteriota bacterium]